MTVYDFDNTIYKGESSVDFFKFCLRKHPFMARYAPIIFWKLLCYRLGKLTKQDIMRYGERVLCSFLKTCDDLDTLLSEFWDKNEHKIKDFYLAQQNEHDVIISGCAEPVLAEICRRLGIENYFGTKLDLESGKIKFLCYNDNKVKLFKETFPGCSIDSFYSDSIPADRPMMQFADRAFLVTGERIMALSDDQLTA